MRTFGDALRLLMGLYPRFDLTAEQAGAWAASLADVDTEALCTAAIHLSHESEFPPSVKAWRERALTASGEGGAYAQNATDAWDEMRRHRTRRAQTRYDLNPYVPKWSSEAVRRASEAVLWDDPNWETEQIPTIRAQFERHFNACRSQSDAIEASQVAEHLMPKAMRAIGRGGDGPRPLMGGGA